MVNKMYLDKAEVLIEALPYIRRFNRKVIIVKYGGSAMVDEELKRNVIKDVVSSEAGRIQADYRSPAAGKEISRWVGYVYLLDQPLGGKSRNGAEIYQWTSGD